MIRLHMETTDLIHDVTFDCDFLCPTKCALAREWQRFNLIFCMSLSIEFSFKASPSSIDAWSVSGAAVTPIPVVGILSGGLSQLLDVL